jgi:hypothetical protein
MNGNTIIHIAPGISMMRFEYREAMDKTLEQWEEHKKSLPIPPKDEVYSFAYWLYRYSGLIKPVE